MATRPNFAQLDVESRDSMITMVDAHRAYLEAQLQLLDLERTAIADPTKENVGRFETFRDGDFKTAERAFEQASGTFFNWAVKHGYDLTHSQISDRVAAIRKDLGERYTAVRMTVGHAATHMRDKLAAKIMR